MNNTFLNF